MSWSYAGDPAASDLDAVRYLSGQHSTGDDVLVEDEEVLWALQQEGDVYFAAALVAAGLGVRYAGRVTSKTVGDLSLRYEGRSQEYTARSIDLRRRGLSRTSGPVVAGQTDADRSADASGTVAPSFRVGMDDTPGTARAATYGEAST